MDARRPDSPALRFLAPSAARTLGRVAPSSLPVLCLDSFGPAFGRVAEAIHAASGRDRLLRVDLRGPRDGLLAGLIRAATSPRCTLALDGVEGLDDAAQVALLRLLDGDGPRLVSASLADLATLRSKLRPDLHALITTITVRTPALARAGLAIAEIAEARLAALAVELGIDVPALGPSAVEALSAHEWPGDVVELDAVLARTLLALEGTSVASGDLRWEPLDPQPVPPGRAQIRREVDAAEVSTGRGGTTDDERSPGVGSEAIAVELAHRIKNPLVTVRTFVQSVTQLAGDPADLARFRDLTEEAITRMDDALEDILAFSRLAPPAPDAIEVVGVLRDALREASDARPDADAPAAVEFRDDARLVAVADEPRLRAALASVARHVFETIDPHGTLSVSVEGDGLVLRHPEAGATSHLRGVTGLDEDLPLPLLLARGALAPGGASLEVRDEDGRRRIDIRFPGAAARRTTSGEGTASDGLRRDA